MDETSSPADVILERVRALEPLVEFRAAATEDRISSVERRLGARLPAELRGFLLASDGATKGQRLDSGEVIRHADPLVWSLAEIEASLEPDPILPRPPGILFFATAGVDGVLFGHPIRSPSLVDPDVVWWDPVPDGINRAAPSFWGWLDAWLKDELAW